MTPRPVGREEALRRARAVVEQWPELADLDVYTKGGIARMMVGALVDGEAGGFDFDMSSRLDEVAAVAQASAAKNAPWSEPNPDEGFVFTINARRLSQDVIRAAVKAGVVVAASDRALTALALHGSAGHDDTAQTLGVKS